MHKIFAALVVLIFAGVIAAPAARAQSSPTSNCRYYVKTQADYEQGLPHCRDAIVEEPENPEVRFYAAVCMAETGHLTEAAETFGWLLERSDHEDKKVRKFSEKAEKQSKFYFQTFFNKGVELLNGQENEAARDEFTKATQIHPKMADGYLNLGYAQTLLSDLDGAIESFRKAIEVDPENQQAYEFCWDALRQRRAQLRAAEETDSDTLAAVQSDLREVVIKVLELDPANAEALLDLGDLELQVGNKEEGLKHIKKAVDVDGSNIYKLAEIGKSFYDNDEYAAAIDAFKVVLEHFGEEEEAYQYALKIIGWSYFLMGEYEESIPILEQLVTIWPLDKQNYVKLAHAHTKLGNSEAASELLVRYEEIKEREIVGE